MSPVVVSLLLICCALAGLVLLALGLPGLWLIVAAVLGCGALTDFQAIGWGTIAVVFALALLGELLELWLGFGLARRYGGSHRAGWGALIGGLVGAVIGVPIPVVGSVVGSLIGSFVGAVMFEYTRSRPDGNEGEAAWRAGWGALLGRVAATAAKMAVGIVMTVVALWRVIASY
jgi:uncharacterized protein